jgi:hypothetical protein
LHEAFLPKIYAGSSRYVPHTGRSREGKEKAPEKALEKRPNFRPKAGKRREKKE